MAANYPISTVTFGSDRIDLTSTVVANDVNSVYREVTAIASDLGAGNMGAGTPGLKYSAAWGVGTFDSTTTTWSGLQARIQNIENGLYRTYTYSVDLQGRENYNTIQSIDANTIGLSIKAGAVAATSVTYGTSDGTTITYTSANKFSVGQKVTVTGLSVSTGMTLNVSLKTITGLVGSGPTYTGFTIAAPGVSGVTGVTSGISTSLTITGDITGVVAGMTVTGTNIATNTKVSSVSGQVVNLDTASTGSVSGSIVFRTIGTSSGTGAATAYQTTALQRWIRADGTTVVASISPDGNFSAAGGAAIAGNASVGGVFAVTGASTFGGAVTVTGAVSVTGTLSATVIDGGTP
jgi:hypothetical protein